MKTGDVYLKLDKEWDMQDFAQTFKFYIQCYSLVYSLSECEIEADNKKANNWFKYTKYPWKGGYSTINFYHNLYKKVPREDQPVIQEIKYSSPGYIKLIEVLVVASVLAGIVDTVTSSIDDIHNTYNSIQGGMSKRQLLKLDIQIKESQLEFIRESNEKLMKKMQIPETMQSELSKRSNDDELIKLKVLMSFYRRVRPLAIMQSEGMLLVEKPSEQKSNK